MPLWLGSTWLHGTKVSHPAELSRACHFGSSSILSVVKLGQVVLFGCTWSFMLQECMSFPVILCSRKNWVSSICRGRAELREARVTCPGITYWTSPGVGKGLDGWWSSDVLSFPPHGLCCVYLETSFQSSGSTLSIGSSTWSHLRTPWNGWILCHSGFSWRNEVLGTPENPPVEGVGWWVFEELLL